MGYVAFDPCSIRREARSLKRRHITSLATQEFKHQNISAVLVNMGLPYIDGYKPARNYQKAVLPKAIEDYLIKNPDYLDVLAEGRVLNPVSLPDVDDGPVESTSRIDPQRSLRPRGTTNPGSPAEERRSTSHGGTPRTEPWGASARNSPPPSSDGV